VEELKVYSRCEKSKTIPGATCQTYDLNSGNTTTIPDTNLVIPVVDDTNIPIAQHKGVRSCIHHSISNFVSYEDISPSYRSFVSKLSSVSIPRNLQEALSDPTWRTVMQEEMKTLHKNQTWDLVKFPNGKNCWMHHYQV
jgi:hypothetical protein